MSTGNVLREQIYKPSVTLKRAGRDFRLHSYQSYREDGRASLIIDSLHKASKEFPGFIDALAALDGRSPSSSTLATLSTMAQLLYVSSPRV